MDDVQATLSVENDLVRVLLSGELDIASAQGLDPIVLAVLLLGVRWVVVDLRLLWFCDVAGVRQLVAAHRRWCNGGLTVTLDGASPSVRQLFDLTGHAHLLAPKEPSQPS